MLAMAKTMSTMTITASMSAAYFFTGPGSRLLPSTATRENPVLTDDFFCRYSTAGTSANRSSAHGY